MADNKHQQEARKASMERRLKPGVSHVVVHRRNRALVDGRTSRLWFRLLGLLVLFPLAIAVCLLFAWQSYRHGPEWLALVLSGSALLSVILMLWVSKQRAEMKRNGHLLTATVTGVDRHSSPVPYGASYFDIHYRFSTPDGEACKGTKRLDTPLCPFFTKVPSVGDHIAILYLETRWEGRGHLLEVL